MHKGNHHSSYLVTAGCSEKSSAEHRWRVLLTGLKYWVCFEQCCNSVPIDYHLVRGKVREELQKQMAMLQFQQAANTVREKEKEELHCRSCSQEKVWLLTCSGKHNAGCSPLQEDRLCPGTFAGFGRNERMLSSKRCPSDIRREQELLNFLTYCHSWMRPPVIFAACWVLGALESLCQQHLVAHTAEFIQTSTLEMLLCSGVTQLYFTNNYFDISGVMATILK